MAGASGAPVQYVMGPKINELFGSGSTAQSLPNPTTMPVAQAPITPAATASTATPTATVSTATPAAPSPQFNVNTAASQGLQSAMNTTAAGQGFNSARQAPSYFNPFASNVIGGLANQADINYQKAANQIGAEATAAKAFGGSRHGIAQGQALADIQNNLNQQIGNLAYQGYGDSMSRAAADQQMRMSAASQLGNLSNLGFGMGQTINQNMMTQGAMQQALQQMAMDKAAAQYQGYTQSPYTALSALTGALGGTPYGTTTNTTGTTTTPKQGNSLFDYMGLGLYGAGQLGFGV